MTQASGEPGAGADRRPSVPPPRPLQGPPAGHGRSGRAGLLLAFAGLGATAALVPASIPAMAQVLDEDTGVLARVVPALFVGLFLGVALSPRSARRHGPGPVAAAGSGVQALGLGLASLAGNATGVVLAALIAGVGFGVTESSGTALARVSELSSPGRGTGRTLISLTAATAAAAATAPLLVLVGGTSVVRAVLAAAAVLHLLAAMALAREIRGRHHTSAPRGVRRQPLRVGRLGWAVFFYVGSETILAGWSAVLLRDALDVTPSIAAAGTSVFWVLLLLGRSAATPVISVGVPPRAVLTACQYGAGVALAGAAASAHGSPTVSVVLLAASATLMGPCYGFLLGEGLDAVPADRAAHLSAHLIALGALGGAVVSGAVALLGDSLTWLALGACTAMLASAVARQVAADATARRGGTLRPERC